MARLDWSLNHSFIDIAKRLQVELQVLVELVLETLGFYLEGRTLFYKNSIVHIVYVILLLAYAREILLNLILRRL